MKKYKYITRFDFGATHGYQFRFYQPSLTAFFADGVHGSKKKALRAAIFYRNKTLKSLGKLGSLELTNNQHEAQSNNTSGVIGVRLTIDERFEKDLGTWHAEYTELDGSKHRLCFSINKHGEIAAFQLACAARYEQHGTLTVTGSIDDLPGILKVPYVLSYMAN